MKQLGPSSRWRWRAAQVFYFTALAMMVLVCCLTPTASAAEAGAGAAADTNAAAQPAPAPAAPAQAPIIPTVWVVMLVLTTAYWLGVAEMVNRDVQHVHYKEKTWNAAFLVTGLAGFFLTATVHVAFSVATLLALIGVTVGYVLSRNAQVPADKRIMTPNHISYVVRRALMRMGVKLPELSSSQQTTATIRLLRKDGTSLEAISGVDRMAPEQSEAVLAVKEVIEAAVRARATDIHFEPKATELNIRFRVDGILHALPAYPAQLAPPMISAIKVLADMDMAERRKSQDGTFAGELEGRELDFRTASASSMHGETLTIRILDRSRDLVTLEKLGMDSDTRSRFQRVIAAPHGMLIVAGPTGAGKTTTLYAALLEQDAYQKNIMTIENPIEYRLDNITQTAVNPKAGVTFAATLRSMLRQDPDVIMVGEVRDAETARTALQAAMTGHFVFTTIHANDAVTALFRLMDLGVEPYLVASSLTAILSQRLVRSLCPHCKQPYPPKPELLKKIGATPQQVPAFYKALGCEACQGIGYFGRTGIFELLVLSDAVRDLIRSNPSIQLLKAEARKAGLITLQEHGLRKVAQGVTSLKELVRVTK